MSYEALQKALKHLRYHVLVTPSYVVYYQQLLDLVKRVEDEMWTIENEARSGLRFDNQI